MQTKFKCTSLLRVLVLFLASATLLPAQASDFQVGNFHYWTNDTGVSVAGGYGISGDLVIPEKVTYNGVEYTVTGIWSSGFRSSSITSVVIPGTIKTIEKEAFSYCHELKTVTIAEGVPVIGSQMFAYCENLVSVNIPKSVTAIGDYAFMSCKSLPAAPIGKSVTTIGRSAFSGCSALASVDIPEGVTSIGESAFSSCTSLKSIVIPNSVTTVGTASFSGCTGLESVVLGDGLATIAYKCFENCASLVNLTIGKNVSKLGTESFIGCSALETVIIPAKVTEITYTAFQNCAKLKNLIFSDGTESLHLQGTDIFDNCPLTKIYVGRDMTYSTDVYSRPRYTPLSHNENLTKVTVGNTVTKIGEGLFRNCPNLASVTFGNGLTTIGSSAFTECPSLTSVIIPNNVTNIGGNALTYLQNLTLSDGPETLTLANSAFSGSPLETLHLGRDLSYNYSTYELSPFNSLASLRNLTIGENVSSLNTGLFKNCTALTTVAIPSSVTSIGQEAFSGCTALRSIVIPTGVSSIGDQAFYKSGLRSVTIPASVKTMNGFIFSYSENLSEVIIADGTTNLSYNAAFEKTGLESLYLGRNGDSSNGGSYTGLARLKKVCFSSRITKIPSFKNCPALAEVRVANPVPPKGEENAFSGSSYYTCKLFVPVGSREAYESTKPWSYFLDIEETDEFPAEENLLFADNLSYTLTSESEAIVSACDPQAKEIVIPENLAFATSAISALPVFSGNFPEGENVSFRIVGIGKDAFIGCVPTSLKVEHSTPLPCANVCFEEETLNNCILTVPTPSIAAYAAADVWKEFKTIEGASPVVEATSIEISAPGTTLAVGAELRMTATVLPEDTSDKTVEWSSSDTTKATVDESGLVKGLEPGTVVITATCGSVSDSIEIDVTVPSGIDNIEAGTTEATYYNIHGIKVENPTVPGVYILRNADGSAVKKIVK